MSETQVPKWFSLFLKIILKYNLNLHMKFGELVCLMKLLNLDRVLKNIYFFPAISLDQVPIIMV